MRPETKELYPDNWAELSRETIEEANHICQDCGRSDRTDDIILTTHHKDYDPSNNDPSNRVCLCQGCHLKRQARDLAEATKYNRATLLMQMGQLCLPGLEPSFPKRLSRVVEGKALATAHRKGNYTKRKVAHL